MKGKDCLTLAQFSSDEVYKILSKAMELKRLQRMGTSHAYLTGKVIALIFDKPSTRTRISFEAGLAQLGAHSIFLGGAELQLSRGETIEDTGKVLSRYVDGIVVRTFSQEMVEKLAGAASVPVINGLTDDFHPCQVLADLMTIWEKKERLSGLKLAYVGDGNNVAHSLILGSVKVGINIYLACPSGFEPRQEVVEMAQSQLQKGRGGLDITDNPIEAVREADIIYTDVWVSMGQEKEKLKRTRILKPYRINQELLSQAKKDALVMHCLPAHRGEEITAEVFEGPQSVVFDQAENRLHAQKALLMLLLGGGK